MEYHVKGTVVNYNYKINIGGEVMKDFAYWAVISAIGIVITWLMLGLLGAEAIAITCIFAGLLQILEKRLHPDSLNAHIAEVAENNKK